MRTPPETNVTDRFKIGSEPCANSDWKPYAETIIEFANRMCLERGWITILYELPMPGRRTQYPNLRVDEDSILWKIVTHFHLHAVRCWCNPKKDVGEVLCYATPPENHLLLLDEFQTEGLLPDEVNASVRKILSKEISNRP